MCPSHPSDNDSEAPLPPGADRFWGQMSKASNGRSKAEEEPAAEGPGADDAGEASGEPQKGHGHGHECLEWCPICRSVEMLGTATSPEVRQQFQAIQNEAMQVMKAFVTAYTERTSQEASNPAGSSRNGAAPEAEPEEPRVRDISID